MNDRNPLHLLGTGKHRRTQVCDLTTGRTWLFGSVDEAQAALDSWKRPEGYVIRQRLVEVSDWELIAPARVQAAEKEHS